MMSIWAEAESLDGRKSIEFDATPWFENANHMEMMILANNGWGGCDIAKPILYRALTAGEDAEAKDFAVHLAQSGDFMAFEVRVDPTEALTWIQANRPNLYASVNALSLHGACDVEVEPEHDSNFGYQLALAF